MRKWVLFEPEEDLVLFAGHAVTDHGQKPFNEGTPRISANAMYLNSLMSELEKP